MTYYYYPKDEADRKAIYTEVNKILKRSVVQVRSSFVQDRNFFIQECDSPVIPYVDMGKAGSFLCCVAKSVFMNGVRRRNEKPKEVSRDELLTLLKLRLV